MKKLIYLILFIPVIGFGQTYPHQIEPDTTHRMIMMTDTSVIDSPAMEFLYFSIDSLVEQIARDTLGLDSSFWSITIDSTTLVQKMNEDNLFLMKGAGSSNTGTFVIGLGEDAGASNTGDYNIFMGFEAGLNASSGLASTAVGYRAGYNMSGNYNNFIGREAGYNSTGTGNFYQGYRAGFFQTTGSYNLGIGYEALYGSSGANGTGNVGLGFRTGYSQRGSFGTYIGYQAARSNTTGSSNTAFGYNTLYSNITGNANTAIGVQAGYSSTGSSNVYLGYQAGYNETGSNKLYIENSNSSTPLIKGDFATDEVTINDDLFVNSLETSDYLYSTSDQILGGNWVDGDWTLTGNIDTLFFGDPSNIDTVVVSAGDPDQTLSFSDPDLTISGSGGNTIDISGVNYWDTNSDGIYTLDNVGINTTPHATHPLYVVGTMWLDGPVRDGNGNFSGGTGNIMTANSSGEFLWESPSSIGLSEFNNDAGFVTSDSDNQTLSWTASTGILSISGGNAVSMPVTDVGTYIRPATSTDGVWIPDGLLDKDLQYGTSGQVLASTGTEEVDWITIASSHWTDAGTFIRPSTLSDDVYITDGLLDDSGSDGANGDILTSTGTATDWVTPEIDLTPPIGEFTYSSNTIISSTSNTNLNWNGTTLNDSGFTRNTTSISVPQTGNYLVTVSGTMTINSSCSATQRITVYLTGTGAYARVNGNGSTAKEVPFSITGIVTTGSTISAYGNLSATGGGCAGNIEDYAMAVTYLKS